MTAPRRSLPPGSAYLIGMAILLFALSIFAAYLFFRSGRVSWNTGALLLIPLSAVLGVGLFTAKKR